MRQAQAALLAQEANLEQIGLSVTLSVWNGYYALESANQQIGVSGDLVRTADDNLKVALGRYQAGVGSILDVLTAQTAVASAGQQRILSEEGWELARAQLAQALGRLSSAEPLAAGAALP